MDGVCVGEKRRFESRKPLKDNPIKDKKKAPKKGHFFCSNKVLFFV